ncbi:hypothetical protein KEM48_004372 [Puccinia striiformis f. sp. tritici PST-130]|nr:hypothetical protein KEM48_004372 [Puccinia striiformis f. sp. tritici PST-130]
MRPCEPALLAVLITFDDCSFLDHSNNQNLEQNPDQAALQGRITDTTYYNLGLVQAPALTVPNPKGIENFTLNSLSKKRLLISTLSYSPSP